MRIYEHMTATEHKTNLYMIISCNCNHIRLEIVLNTYDGHYSVGGGNIPFNLSSASAASSASSHIFSSCRHDLKIAILITQCLPAALSIARIRLANPFSVIVLTLIKQCSYVAVGFSFPALTPAFATSIAALCRASLHSTMIAFLSSFIRSLRSPPLSP